MRTSFRFTTVFTAYIAILLTAAPSISLCAAPSADAYTGTPGDDITAAHANESEVRLN